MTFRKIIKFGNSSYVISLPKDWIERNLLKKGSSIELLEENNSLIIDVVGAQHHKEEKEITFTIDDESKIKQCLMHAYINNYTTINLVGEDLSKYSVKIRTVAASLIGLDVVQQSTKKFVLKSYFNLSEFSLEETFGRLNRIVLSMIEDTRERLLTTSPKNEIIKHKEDDVNKLTNLIFKVLKNGLKPNTMRELGLTTDLVLKSWETAIFIEDIANQLKRMYRIDFEKALDQDLVSLYDKIIEQYKVAVMLYFNPNYDKAIDIILKKKDFMAKCDDLANSKKSEHHRLLIEKLKNLVTNVVELAHCAIKFEAA